MVEKYPVDINVQDLAPDLIEYLTPHDFQRVSLDDISSTARDYLQKRDQRETVGCVSLVPNQQWRSIDDYLLYDNSRTLAYVRLDPDIPKMKGTLAINVHFRTTAPLGLTNDQYFSLGIPSRNLFLLKKSLHARGMTSINFISDLEEQNVLRRIRDQIDVDEAGDFLVFLFHSAYISGKYDSQSSPSSKEQAVQELAKAVGSLIITADLFSKKQIAYYQAAAEVDELFKESALVG